MQTVSILIPIFERIEKQLQNHELGKAQQEIATILTHDSKNYFAQALKRRISCIMHICRNPKQSLNAHNFHLERTIKALQHLCQMARKIIIQQQTGELEEVDE
jgi:uncharacterized membrane protein